MSDQLVLLLPNVVVEPLVARWYAWSHMVSPATASLHTAYKYLPLLESFVASPDVHAVACKTPSLRGGPFVDLPKSSIEAVQQLINEVKNQQSKQVEFGVALREAYRYLLNNADGFSIEKHYESMPQALKGYVELFYSLGGAPDLRVLEPLLYKSELHSKSLQSAMIYRAKGDDRTFAFSTPRLSREDAFELNEPFDSEVYDFLARLRFEPQPFETIVSRLKVKDSDIELVKSFFSPYVSPPVHSQAVTSVTQSQTRWRYFGHACVLVEAPDGTNVLVDPLIAYETDGALERFTIQDLPEKIDYVVLTHNHADHVLIETLLAIRYRVDTIVVPRAGGGVADPSLKLMLASIGFKKVIELDSLETLQSGMIRLTALPFLGEHGDLDIRTKAAWLVQTDDRSLLFAADSNNLEPELYEKISAIFGKIDILFLGMECLGAPFSWTYGALLPLAVDRKKDQSRRLNGSDFERGMKVVKSLGCDSVYVYAMGAEPWLQFITSIDPDPNTPPAVNARQLIAECKNLGLTAELLYGSAEVSF